MDTYVILRRNGWADGSALEEAAAKSSQVGDEEMSEDIRWIRSYVIEEPGGGLGTVCIYQGSSARRSASTPSAPASRPTRSSRSPTRCSSAPTRSRPRASGPATRRR